MTKAASIIEGGGEGAHVHVRGRLIQEGEDPVYLCDYLTTEEPPSLPLVAERCLEVQGFDIGSTSRRLGGTAWTGRKLTLNGTIHEGANRVILKNAEYFSD